MQFVDESATELARMQAADSVEPVTVFDPGVVSEARGDISALFEGAKASEALAVS